ncbi:hypothetical protein IU498_06500 [Nocardia beijingensis]|nr:hypothetical protein [Nocardia beijingensis]MBF6074279.1 hypothetical protein [Nocardia beijingensis]
MRSVVIRFDVPEECAGHVPHEVELLADFTEPLEKWLSERGGVSYSNTL